MQSLVPFSLCLFGVAALGKSQSNRQLYFGYYDGVVDATLPYSNLNLAGNVLDAVTMNTEARAKGLSLSALLSVRGLFFKGAKLSPNYKEEWEALAEVSRPLLANGTIMGFNLGDELVWNCISPADVQTAAATVRATFPQGKAVIWYNEAAFFGRPQSEWRDGCGNPQPNFKIPSEIDWFSIDQYHMDGYVKGWVDKNPKEYYQSYIYPNLTSSQKVMLVPGAFGSNVNHYPNGTYICNNACYDTMCSGDATDFYEWALSDDRVAAICPWNWHGCPSCNGSRFTPPHTCCMDEIGASMQPHTSATWAKIGSNISGRTASPMSYLTTLLGL